MPRTTPRFPKLQIGLPDWVEGQLPAADHRFETVDERMELAIALSRFNVSVGGGPFGAAVFNLDTGRLVAPGVNLVVPAGWSGAHAEMVAIAVAQQAAGTHDLGAGGQPRHELVTSCEPCSMCFGATPWSGVKRLVYAACEEDARAIGFDEGPKPKNWIAELESRGIEVVASPLRPQAVRVLQDYASGGGPIYNGRVEA
ncbi:MAG: nucleoside deaminase [Planctomycetota bacterium]